MLTTLLDPEKYNKEDLATLYRERWNAELDLRSIKRTLQMDISRCRTPQLVRKEIWTHILAYNLIRTIMAQAAAKHGIGPRTINFKGSLQFLAEFQRLIDYQEHRGQAHRLLLYQQLLDSIACQRVAERPDRFEPRLLNADPNTSPFSEKPRHVIKSEMIKELGQSTCRSFHRPSAVGRKNVVYLPNAAITFYRTRVDGSTTRCLLARHLFSRC